MKKIWTTILLAILFVNPSNTVSAQSSQPIVHAVMFWMAGCPHCEDVIDNVLPPVREKYGSQFELLMIEVVDTADIEMLLAVAASYNIPKEETGVPFMILGDRVLVGSDQVRENLSSTIDEYLATGGVDWTSNPLLQQKLSTFTPALPTIPMQPVKVTEAPRDNGFTLAIAVMIGMAAVLIYSSIAFVWGRSFSLPTWTNWLVPVLIILGLGVASYLSYIETRSMAAICGPVGDCNAVQQSRYARLFDILPIGVLGLLGYIAMLAFWMVNRFVPGWEKPATIGFFGLAFFAVIFSLYLTYLEPFVIKAVCIWCLSSAVIATLLLLLGTPAAISQFVSSDKE